MNILNSKYSWLLIFVLGCSGFFGKKTDVSFAEIPKYTVKPLAYIPLQPVITGFSSISDICTGFDQLMYVVDDSTQEIISYDQSMVQLGRLKITGVSKVAQRRNLDLLVVGAFDTTINRIKYNLPAIYTIELKNSIYGLNTAKITNKIVHPFYFKSSVKASDVLVKFTGVAILADGSFYISRLGTSNDANQFGGPDNAILLFDNQNQFQNNIIITTGSGNRDDYFVSPQGVATFILPPQSVRVIDNKDFVFISNGLNVALKTQWISQSVVEGTDEFQLNQNLVVGDTSKAKGFLYQNNKFSNPSDITFSGDGTQLIFISDRDKDSVFVFTQTGLEGIIPPAGSSQTKNINVSFGGTGVGLFEFNKPTAVAYANKILFVGDAGNKRILRFKLTSDFGTVIDKGNGL